MEAFLSPGLSSMEAATAPPGDQRPLADTSMDIDMNLDLGPEPEPEPEPEPIHTVSVLTGLRLSRPLYA